MGGPNDSDKCDAQVAEKTLTGIEIIAVERQRQIKSEGFTEGHDKDHENGELATAAACYAMPKYIRPMASSNRPMYWPWDYDWWKPTPEDRIRELAKSGALIAAEIDRLQAE